MIQEARGTKEHRRPENEEKRHLERREQPRARAREREKNSEKREARAEVVERAWGGSGSDQWST